MSQTFSIEPGLEPSNVTNVADLGVNMGSLVVNLVGLRCEALLSIFVTFHDVGGFN